MDPLPLNALLYNKLIALKPSDRVRLFDFIHFYVRDTTFIARARNREVQGTSALTS